MEIIGVILVSKQKIQKIVDENYTTTENGLIIRVACYIRVSTQEQKLHGISLDAQRDKLKEYAEKHKLKIVGWYEDEGISGRKLIRNRPALQRMLNDAQAGKFDRIIFIKLDRFFRSVAEYHECMKKINPILWTATEEKYDLTTANGRAFVNMKLTIAELEADQTGERIDLVNEYKVKTGQALSGSQNQGYGYMVKPDNNGVKRVVKDPEAAPIVEDYINHFLTYQNKRQAHIYVKNKYNINVSYNSLSRILEDTKLYGSYRGNDTYIDKPYIDKSTFNKIQKILKNNIKKTGANRVYLYSGLIRCPVCGKTMTGKYSGGKKINKKPSGKIYTYYTDYYNYRCNFAYKDDTCKFRKQPNEDYIEKTLLDNLDQYINTYISEVSVMDNSADKDNEQIKKKITSIKSEMTKVKRMYRKEDITEAEYDEDMAELKDELRALESHLAPVEERDISKYDDLLKSGWRGLYNALTKENKRAFWRKYLKGIELNEDGTVKSPIFF